MTDTCDAPSYSRYVHNRCPLGRCLRRWLHSSQRHTPFSYFHAFGASQAVAVRVISATSFGTIRR